MNKDKIKKALECCNAEVSCNDCPYFKEAHCNDALSKDALNLITEQEKEIERLKEELIVKYRNYYDKVVELLEAQQENEQIRGQAVKEFAERLKEKLFSVFGKTLCSEFDTEDITIFIDELLKEYEK